MSLIEITKDIYYYPFDDKYLRPNLFYIRGDKKSIAVDAGNSKMHRNDFFEELEKFKFDEPEAIVLTHCHWDHTLGLDGYQGQSIATRISKERLAEFRDYSWSKDNLKEITKKGFMTKFSYLYMRKVYRNNPIIIPEIKSSYENEKVFDLGNLRVHLLETKNPHSEDSTVIWIPERKVVIIGDSDYPSYKDNAAFFDQEKTVTYCEELEKLPFEYYCGSHIEPLNRTEGLKKLEELRKQVE